MCLFDAGSTEHFTLVTLFYINRLAVAFRSITILRSYKVSVLTAFNADDIHPGVLQQFDVGVNALASGLNAALLPERENVCDRDRMLLVCLLI